MVLIVDDEDVCRKMIIEYVNEMGYSYSSFDNAFDALDFYRNNYLDIELVISDYFMPLMNGKELYNSLKKINSNINFLLISAMENVNNWAPNYLRKPILYKTFYSKINEII